MKTINKILITALFICFGFMAQAQINSKINSRSVVKSNYKALDRPVALTVISERDFKNIKTKNLRESSSITMKVPAAYLKKRAQKRLKITPARAFGTGNLGLTVFSGELHRSAFRIQGDIIAGKEVTYVAYLEFDAKSSKTYLIRIKSRGAGSTSYLNALAGGQNLKVHGQDGSYLILVEAQETGKMLVPFSARHKVGGNERYPETFAVQEIIIDEL